MAQHPTPSLAQIETHLGRVALGDRAAFAALYDATSAKLFSVCLRVLGERAEAEDALQEVYVKIWRGAGRYQVNGLSPMTWLITIARNTAVDRLRARKRHEPATGAASSAEPADPAPDPEAQVIAGQGRAQLNACLDALPLDRADAVRGAYLDGASYADLAARHGVPLNTMRTWLRRSLIALKECLSR